MPLDENDLKAIKDMIDGVETSITNRIPAAVKTTISEMAEDNKRRMAKAGPAKKAEQKAEPKADDKPKPKTLADMTEAEIERMPRRQLLAMQAKESEDRMAALFEAKLAPVAKTADSTSGKLMSAEFLGKYPEAKFLNEQLSDIVERGEATTLKGAMAVLKEENPDAHKEALVAYQKEEGTYEDPEEAKAKAEVKAPPLAIYARPSTAEMESITAAANGEPMSNKSAAAAAYDAIAASEGVSLETLPIS